MTTMKKRAYNGFGLRASGSFAVNFLCAWDRRGREVSWSGIHLGLFSSLQEFADVIDIPLLYNFTARALGKARNILDRLTGSSDFMTLHTRMCEHQIRRAALNKNAPCLMFTEYLTEYTPQSYLYQDLTVDYLMRMRVNPRLMKYTPLPPRVRPEKAQARLEHTMKVNRTCAGLFTMSEYLADDLVRNSGIDPAKVHHVGGGCNIDTSRINTQGRNGWRFLFAGRDWERKNGALVVEAFVKLRRKYSDAELYIAGPSRVPDEVSGVEGVKFLGLLGYGELTEYFNLCDFFVMPSKFEAYGIVFPEALIFGLPCIGKDTCAMPEFIQDGVNGALIHDDDPDELAGCMERLITDRKDLKAYVAAMHEEYLRKYSWSAVAERIVKVMKDDGF